MSHQEILSKIVEAIPASKQFITSNLDSKLSRLRSKSNSSGRQISWHRKEGGYALRFEERKMIIEENAEEIRLYSAIGDEITSISRDRLPERLHVLVPRIVESVRDAIEVLFRKQGIDLGLFLSGADEIGVDGIDIASEIDRYTDEITPRQADRSIVRDCIAESLRRMIYSPSPDQGEFMRRLSATYFVLFALKNEPRVVEYFQGMSSNLVLYVGSDLLIKAISEYHLPKDGQLILNTFSILKTAGSKLILTETALEEVFTHIHASVLEFENYYMPVENKIGEDFIQAIDRILIRAYFYAKLKINIAGRPPAGWKSYIGQFCSYQEIRHKKGQRSLQMYLCDRFGLQFEKKEDMLKSVDRAEHSKLATSILEEKRNKRLRAQILAYNDSLQALRIFSKRLELDEQNVPNPYGFKTWWLTHERTTERAAGKAFQGRLSRFVMRPEFLLNYIGLLPSKADILKSYKSVFPSILAVSLGRRAPPGVINGVLKAAMEAGEVDESRAKVMLSEFADQLKSDKLRKYETEITSQ